MSLHTKYRPTTFAEVIGHDALVRSLQRVVKDRRAHTFLFTGPAGTGKTTLARILANEFAGKHATVANIDEVAAADNTGVEDMRAVVNRSMFRAIGPSPVKAIILDEAHRLSGNAWDAILKATEEPPDHVYWMVCTTNMGKIPKTIQTRFLRYDLKPVSEELIFKLLVKVADAEKLEVEDDVLAFIAESAGGSPRQGLVYLEACATAATVGEARLAIGSAGQSKEVIDLCRWLVKGRSHTWAEAVKYVKALETNDAEGIRIVVSNYIAGYLISTKDDKVAGSLLALLECFREPYNQSDKLAPLLYSLGMALRLDQ